MDPENSSPSLAELGLAKKESVKQEVAGLGQGISEAAKSGKEAITSRVIAAKEKGKSFFSKIGEFSTKVKSNIDNALNVAIGATATPEGRQIIKGKIEGAQAKLNFAVEQKISELKTQYQEKKTAVVDGTQAKMSEISTKAADALRPSLENAAIIAGKIVENTENGIKWIVNAPGEAERRAVSAANKAKEFFTIQDNAGKSESKGRFLDFMVKVQRSLDNPDVIEAKAQRREEKAREKALELRAKADRMETAAGLATAKAGEVRASIDVKADKARELKEAAASMRSARAA